MPATKRGSKKCKQGSHRNRSTKKCRCTKVCRVVGGRTRRNRKQN